ncbi:MAG: hypothetical protein ACRYG5_08815 [Janthinobacterium lividum]
MSASQKHKKAGDRHAHKLTLTERRELVLDRIALQRIEMRQAAERIASPVRSLDRIRARIVDSRLLFLPLLPLGAIVLFRSRGLMPVLRGAASLGARGFGIWRLYRQFF